jgi:hypothetical protein
MNRRRLLQTAAGVGALGVLPMALPAPQAAAFRTFSGCKKRCKRFEGQCRSRCIQCCRKVVKGNQNRCDFGCGVIKSK